MVGLLHTDELIDGIIYRLTSRQGLWHSAGLRRRGSLISIGTVYVGDSLQVINIQRRKLWWTASVHTHSVSCRHGSLRKGAAFLLSLTCRGGDGVAIPMGSEVMRPSTWLCQSEQHTFTQGFLHSLHRHECNILWSSSVPCYHTLSPITVSLPLPQSLLSRILSILFSFFIISTCIHTHKNITTTCCAWLVLLTCI